MEICPNISIIIPVYKAELYLKECVESILIQTYENFELILVDDGSPDNSGIICDELALEDSRIKVLHKPNGGATSARKYGVEHAIGEWILFSDADDEMPSDALECLFNKIGPNIEFVAGTIYYQSINRTIISEIDASIISPYEYICLLLNHTTYYGPCSKLIKKTLFDNLQWLDDKSVYQNEDLLMLIQIASKITQSIYICNEGIHYICISREGSTSSKLMPYSGWKKLLIAIEDTLTKSDLFGNELKKSFINYTIFTLYYFCICRRQCVPHDEFVTHILEIAELKYVDNDNVVAYKHLQDRCLMYWKVISNRVKDFVKKCLPQKS